MTPGGRWIVVPGARSSLRFHVRPAQWALGLLVTLVSSSAAAQPVPSFDARDLRPPVDPRSSVFLEPTSTPLAGEWNLGGWASYAFRPVTLQNAAGDRIASPVEHQVSLDAIAGVSLSGRLLVGATLPVIASQSGDDAQGLVPGAAPVPSSAIGDLGASAKGTLVPTKELGGFGLAIVGRATVPTGDPRGYGSEAGATGELRALGELDLLALSIEASAGGRVRQTPVTFAGTELGHGIPWGAGIGFRPQAIGIDSKGRWRWTLEGHGIVGIDSGTGESPQSPAAIALSARYTVDDVSALFAVEMPASGALGVPLARGIVGIGWAPRFYDQDGDGWADERDECPELGEDRDGFEDSDGCPDFDNDDDGVADESDQCPAEREDEDGHIDDDGCIDADDDGDGVTDTDDACPANPRGPHPDPVRLGCPAADRDHDGLFDPDDKCPKRPEDLDGHDDTDGCPDLDDDRDGIPDAVDECKDCPGPARPDSVLHGCPSPDRDGDTWDDTDDRCPDVPEDFDGVDDGDGCPDPDAAGDPQAKPLIAVTEKDGEHRVAWREHIRFGGAADAPEVDSGSMPTVRALAVVLTQNPRWIFAVGVRPAGATREAEQRALSRSFSVANLLRGFTYRDDAAESLSWAAVKKLPGAARDGVGILVLAPRLEPAAGAK